MHSHFFIKERAKALTSSEFNVDLAIVLFQYIISLQYRLYAFYHVSVVTAASNTNRFANPDSEFCPDSTPFCHSFLLI